MAKNIKYVLESIQSVGFYSQRVFSESIAKQLVDETQLNLYHEVKGANTSASDRSDFLVCRSFDNEGLHALLGFALEIWLVEGLRSQPDVEFETQLLFDEKQILRPYPGVAIDEPVYDRREHINLHGFFVAAGVLDLVFELDDGSHNEHSFIKGELVLASGPGLMGKTSRGPAIRYTGDDHQLFTLRQRKSGLISH